MDKFFEQDHLRPSIATFLNWLNSTPRGGGAAFGTRFAWGVCEIEASEVVVLEGTTVVVKLRPKKNMRTSGAGASGVF